MSTGNPPTGGPSEPRQMPNDQTVSPASAKPFDCIAHANDQDDVAACPEGAPHSKGRALLDLENRMVWLFLRGLRWTDKVEGIEGIVDSIAVLGAGVL